MSNQNIFRTGDLEMYYNESDINLYLINLTNALDLKTPIDFSNFTDKIDDLTILYNQTNMTHEVEFIKDPIDGYQIKLQTNGQSYIDRFNIAKALGYIFLGFLDNYPELTQRFANELEYPADYFALKLMIPSNEIKNYIKNDHVDIEELSDIFEIPIECVKRRINIYNNGD